MATDRPVTKPSTKRRAAATTPEARENQLIALSYDFAEEQLRAGTASSQLATHFLKAGSVRDQLEKEKIRRENLLLEAKVKQIEETAELKVLFTDAMEKLTGYTKGPAL